MIQSKTVKRAERNGKVLTASQDSDRHQYRTILLFSMSTIKIFSAFNTKFQLQFCLSSRSRTVSLQDSLSVLLCAIWRSNFHNVHVGRCDSRRRCCRLRRGRRRCRRSSRKMSASCIKFTYSCFKMLEHIFILRVCSCIVLAMRVVAFILRRWCRFSVIRRGGRAALRWTWSYDESAALLGVTPAVSTCTCTANELTESSQRLAESTRFDSCPFLWQAHLSIHSQKLISKQLNVGFMRLIKIFIK